MMEREISERYFFDPFDYDKKGRRRKDGLPFRELVREFERDFHARHTTEYALNFYSNSKTMRLLEKSCDAAPFLTYGMDLTQGMAFDAEKDPYINHEIDKCSRNIFVYGIYPLTLLIDKTMRDNEVRLAVPTLDDGDETEDVTIDVPQFEYV